jgi:type I protein arginine methyltransferase
VHEKSALPAEISEADFSGVEYLRPVVEDDALILALDSLPESRGSNATGKEGSSTAIDTAEAAELHRKNEQLQSELESLNKQFENYRLAVQKTLDQRWGVDEEPQKVVNAAKHATAPNDAKTTLVSKKSDEERVPSSGGTDYYFESYSHSGKFMPRLLAARATRTVQSMRMCTNRNACD